MPAPTFVEAIAGRPDPTPGPEQIAAAAQMLARLVASGAVIALNLFGAAPGIGVSSFVGEHPDFLATPEALPYLYALQPERNPKREPATAGNGRVSPLAAEAWKLLEREGALTTMELRSQLGREVTEAAVLRSLAELWHTMRVVPVPAENPQEGAHWELLSARHRRELNIGSTQSQTTALSILVSFYLQSAVSATAEEVEIFLSPVASRSRLRDVVHGLSTTRQLASFSLAGDEQFYVEGSLPEVAEEEETIALAASTADAASLDAGLEQNEPSLIEAAATGPESPAMDRARPAAPRRAQPLPIVLAAASPRGIAEFPQEIAHHAAKAASAGPSEAEIAPPEPGARPSAARKERKEPGQREPPGHNVQTSSAAPAPVSAVQVARIVRQVPTVLQARARIAHAPIVRARIVRAPTVRIVVVPHVRAALHVPALPGSASATPLVSSAVGPPEAVSTSPAASASPEAASTAEAASIRTGRQGPPAAASGATSRPVTTRPALVKARSARASAPPVRVRPVSDRVVPAVPPREPASARPGPQASVRHVLSAPAPRARARDAAPHVPIALSASRSEIGPQADHAASTAVRRAGTDHRAPRATGPSSGRIPPRAPVPPDCRPDRPLQQGVRHPAAQTGQSAHSRPAHAQRASAHGRKAASAERAPSAPAVRVPADSASPVDGHALSASLASLSPATESPQPAEQERASPSSIAPGLIAPNLTAPDSIGLGLTGPGLIAQRPIVPALPVPHSVLVRVLPRLPMRLQAARRPGGFRKPAGPGKSFGRPRPAGASSGKPRPAGKGRTSTTTSSGKPRRPGGFDKPRPGGAAKPRTGGFAKPGGRPAVKGGKSGGFKPGFKAGAKRPGGIAAPKRKPRGEGDEG